MRIFTWLSLTLLFATCHSQKYYGELDLVPNIADIPQAHVSVEIDYDVTVFSAEGSDLKETGFDGKVTIDLVVEDGGVWNGIGFGAQVMNGTYAIILDYDEGTATPIVQEVTLGHHDPGQWVHPETPIPYIGVVSDAFVDPNGREVTIERAVGYDVSGIYFFPPRPQSKGAPIEIPMIAAVGPAWNIFLGPQSRHSQFNREPVTLVLFEVTNATSTEPPITSTETLLEEACCECLEINNFGRCFNQFGPVVDCENLICSKDAYCCTNRWDEICIQQASGYCEGNAQPLCCACTVGQGGQAGCAADPECESTICAQDPYCCGADGVGFWDKKCVNEAYALCSPQQI